MPCFLCIYGFKLFDMSFFVYSALFFFSFFFVFTQCWLKTGEKYFLSEGEETGKLRSLWREGRKETSDDHAGKFSTSITADIQIKLPDHQGFSLNCKKKCTLSVTVLYIWHLSWYLLSKLRLKLSLDYHRSGWELFFCLFFEWNFLCQNEKRPESSFESK